MLSREMLVGAVQELCLLKFFPSGPGEQEAVMRLLDAIVDRPERLRWLVDTLLNYVGEWPGPAQVRAIYATQWTPRDGVEGPHCTIHGLRPVDSEAQSLEAHEKLKIEGPRKSAGLLRITGGV